MVRFGRKVEEVVEEVAPTTDVMGLVTTIIPAGIALMYFACMIVGTMQEYKVTEVGTISAAAAALEHQP